MIFGMGGLGFGDVCIECVEFGFVVGVGGDGGCCGGQQGGCDEGCKLLFYYVGLLFFGFGWFGVVRLCVVC